MLTQSTELKDIIKLYPLIHHDNRGYFYETFNDLDFNKALCPYSENQITFVQDNESYSHYGVLRGMHYQETQTQGKLVRCVYGKIQDVVVDLRPGSETYGKYISVILDSETKNMLWIPKGWFAHGFLVLSGQGAIINYKCTDYYCKEDSKGIRWDSFNIKWEKLDVNYIISEQDQKWEKF